MPSTKRFEKKLIGRDGKIQKDLSNTCLAIGMERPMLYCENSSHGRNARLVNPAPERIMANLANHRHALHSLVIAAGNHGSCKRLAT